MTPPPMTKKSQVSIVAVRESKERHFERSTARASRTRNVARVGVLRHLAASNRVANNPARVQGRTQKNETTTPRFGIGSSRFLQLVTRCLRRRRSGGRGRLARVRESACRQH